MRKARKKADSPCRGAYDPRLSGLLERGKKSTPPPHGGGWWTTIMRPLEARPVRRPARSAKLVPLASSQDRGSLAQSLRKVQLRCDLRRAMPGHLAARDLRTICTGLAVPQCHDQPPGSATSHGPLQYDRYIGHGHGGHPGSVRSQLHRQTGSSRKPGVPRASPRRPALDYSKGA